MIREIILGVMCVIFLIGYLKSCFRIDKDKMEGILYIFLMTFMFLISICLNFTLIKEEEDFEQEIKELKQCLPQYEEIHGVYVIKKK